jgi:hypothetical protein
MSSLRTYWYAAYTTSEAFWCHKNIPVTKIRTLQNYRYEKQQQQQQQQNDDKMTPWSQFLKQTVKGSAVTLGSTGLACVLACYIEVGAHRLVYLCFPHKYAHIEHANGLTREQLDAVKPHNVKTDTSINEDKWRIISGSECFL